MVPDRRGQAPMELMASLSIRPIYNGSEQNQTNKILETELAASGLKFKTFAGAFFLAGLLRSLDLYLRLKTTGVRITFGNRVRTSLGY